MALPKPGDRISNYLLERMAGSGAFGQVWRARHHILPQVVAIKIPNDPRDVRNLQREAVVIHGLRHGNIVRAIDLDPYSDPPYLIMEYVDGPSVKRLLQLHPHGLPHRFATVIMRGVLSALSYAHRFGVIHGDIKPENILLVGPEDRLDQMSETSVRVTDFGLGRMGELTTSSVMQSGSLKSDDGRRIAGTLAYMAPEQREGLELDARADLYSCGVVLFEMLTGCLPQGADSPGSIRPALPTYLDLVFSRCYTRRERRFATAEEMLTALLPPPGNAGEPISTSFTGPVCPSCRELARPDDQFCIHCGQQLVDFVPHCPSCSAFVHRRDRYCIFCGTDLKVRMS